MQQRKAKVLPPLHPNVGIRAEYRRRLEELVQAMHKSILYWVTSAYRNNEPATIAQDEAPVAALRAAMRKMSRQWQRNFNAAAPKLADYFAKSTSRRTDAALKKILKDAGISVEFRLTAGARDVLRSTITANVALIKSIPQKYLTDVEGMVMRSVQTGRGLSTLTDEIEKSYAVTRRRAALIARDQNNKATAAIERQRRLDMNITEAVWMHSHGGKTPRPTHVKMDGKKYDVRKGMYDPAVKRYILPGEEINCRCVSRAVVPGF